MAKMNIKGEELEGEFVAFTPIQEDWNEYRVGDYIVKLKLIVSDIFQANDKLDPQGNPVFYVKSQNVVNVRKAE